MDQLINADVQYMVGDVVVFINPESHNRIPSVFPVPDTVGVVVSVGEEALIVQWPKGSTSGMDEWPALKEWVRPVPQDITDIDSDALDLFMAEFDENC